MAKINKVLYNIDQTGDTSSVEKRTARNNIGCPSIITSTNTLPPVETDINTLTFKTDSRVYADNNVIGNIAPNPGQTDAGKFLVAQWAGSPAIGTYGLAAINQLPASTISNSGQALIVDASGNPVWSNAHYVSYDASQGLTAGQQKNARLNIAAVSQSQISDLFGLLYIRSMSNSYWVSDPITWPVNSSRHTWRGIATWTLQPGDTLFCMLNGQLTESMDGSTEWAVSLNTSDAYPTSEAFSHYFSTNSRSGGAATWTNVPGTMLSYSNGNSEQNVTMGMYNSSSALTDSSANLYGKVYGTTGDGRMLSGPCVWYCIFNTKSRGYQET